MSKIEQTKDYTGKDLETIFFRPMLTGPAAQELGIKVMYNMPVPTTLHFWKRDGDILQKFNNAGWQGGSKATTYQKTVELSRVKAEMGYSAEDYFSKVFELVTNRSDVNMEDLTGTELEEAETALFRESIAESIRATMWLGDTSRTNPHSQYALNTFDGFIKMITADLGTADDEIRSFVYDVDTDTAESILKNAWTESSEILRSFKSQGNLAYFVTSDIYAKYEDELDDVALETAYLAKQAGREGLSYRGIPVIDIQIGEYLSCYPSLPQSFVILTDRRNLALAVNTSDYPGTEIRMWYNPDAMENRQRAIFMAGCDYLMPELVTFAKQQ